jgi:hypothetical protein
VQCLLKALADRFLKAKEHTPYIAQHWTNVTFTDEALYYWKSEQSQTQVELFCSVIKHHMVTYKTPIHELKQKRVVLPFCKSFSHATGRFMELTNSIPHI